jgi:hypothetical protein
MPPRVLIPLLLAGLITGLGAAAAPITPSPVTPVFERDVRPIFKEHCFQCHGEAGETKNGLDLRLRRFIVKGGKSGPAIAPGQPAESHLLDLVRRGEMPKSKPRLPEAQLAIIERWIAAGAPVARPEPESLGPESRIPPRRRVRKLIRWTRSSPRNSGRRD